MTGMLSFVVRLTVAIVFGSVVLAVAVVASALGRFRLARRIVAGSLNLVFTLVGFGRALRIQAV